MNLSDERLKELDDPSLTVQQRVLLRCRVAADLIDKGQYEAAREALGELWRGFGERPDGRNMPPVVTAEVLLQCGALTGWFGSVWNVSDAQDKAKDLLFEALRLFQSQGRYVKASEVQYTLGTCYWRLGAHDEARMLMQEALKPLTDADVELRAKIHIRRTLVEISENRHHEALGILKEAEPVFASANDALKGRWHGQMALVLEMLATAEKDADLFDRAIIEYTAAIVHYEQAGHERHCARNLNNLAMLLHKLSRHGEAHEHLDRARRIFTRLEDGGNLAQVNETRARVFLAEQKYREANRVIAEAIRTLEQGGEAALLADAYTVQGVVRARLGSHQSSINILRHSIDVAEGGGAHTSAGLAALTLIEEHGAERLSSAEIYNVYARADRLLKDTQDAGDVARLRSCARIAMRRLAGLRPHDQNFTFYNAVHELEARLIEQALEEAGGSVSRAAKLLGMRHQTLGEILRRRHQSLLDLRTPAARRKKSIIDNAPRTAGISAPERHPVAILFVGDNRSFAGAVRDGLEAEGWSIIMCSDGAVVLKSVESDAPYDLLLLDYDLPSVNGIEIVRRAKELPHRRRTPVVMFSASDVETEAWRAGVDAFLSKPDVVGRLTGIVARLLR